MLLHLDCGAGISGAATLAALAHLGVDYAPLAEALARVGVLCSIEVADAVGPAGPGCSVSICWKNGGQLPCRALWVVLTMACIVYPLMQATRTVHDP